MLFRAWAPGWAVVLLLAAGSAAWAGETIRLNGSGSALDMMRPLVAAYAKLYPEVRVDIERPLGSSGAVKALLAGALDLAVSSKPLTAEQLAQGARAQAYGQTPLAIVTEKTVPVKDLKTSELEEIYAGRRQKWPNGESVRVVLRPEHDIDTTILRGLSPGMNRAISEAQAYPGMATAVTDPESNDLVSRIPGAIGASGLTGVLQGPSPLSIVALNGVRPTVKDLAAGAYPLAKDIRFVVGPRVTPAVKDLLDFVYSARGRSIAEAAGVLVTADATGR